MKKILVETWHNNLYLKILTFAAIGLIIASFCVPPMGVIDGSVLAGVGELFAFGALWQVAKAIDKGLDTKVQHNNTSITVGDFNKEENNDE